MYKIFFNDIPVFLTSELPHKVSKQAKKPIVFVKPRKKDVLTIIKQIEKGEYWDEVWIVRKNVEKLYQQFSSFFKKIDAAGGVVFDGKGAMLMIYRREKWDLPKGKVEDGETMDEAALREVSEETNLQQLTLKAPVQIPINQKNVTYHTYLYKEKRVLKTTYWYTMSATDTDNVQPQTEEDIEAIEWVALDDVKSFLAQSYASIRDVVHSVLIL